MFFRFSMGDGLIAASVVIRALFMTIGLNNFKRVEEHIPEPLDGFCSSPFAGGGDCSFSIGLMEVFFFSD